MTGSMRGAVVLGLAHLGHDFVALLFRSSALPPDTEIAEPTVQDSDGAIDEVPRAIHDRDP